MGHPFDASALGCVDIFVASEAECATGCGAVGWALCAALHEPRAAATGNAPMFVEGGSAGAGRADDVHVLNLWGVGPKTDRGEVR